MECKGRCLISCVHKNHNGYCPNECCEPQKCLYCTKTRPQYLLDKNNFMSSDCNHEMRPILGQHQNTNEIEECPVCLQDKNMTVLQCNHKICNGCWYTIALDKYKNAESRLCPLCRNINIKVRV
jgi:hypothetical protein